MWHEKTPPLGGEILYINKRIDGAETGTNQLWIFFILALPIVKYNIYLYDDRLH